NPHGMKDGGSSRAFSLAAAPAAGQNTPMDTTSATLLEKLRRPDAQEAWTRFVELYTPLLYHWGRQLGLAAEGVADLVQDVLTPLWKRLRKFQSAPAKSFGGCLHRFGRTRWRARCGRWGARVAPDQPLPDVEVPDPTTAFAEAEYRQHLVQQ